MPMNPIVCFKVRIGLARGRPAQQTRAKGTLTCFASGTLIPKGLHDVASHDTVQLIVIGLMYRLLHLTPLHSKRLS